MKKLILILTFFTAFILGSCSRSNDDPLTIPPKYNDMPDVNHPEEPSKQEKDADIEKLKDLLLKSE